MFLQSRLSRFTSRMSLLAFVAALSAVAWSAPALAHAKGVIGYGYQQRIGPPKGFEPFCKFTYSLACNCRPKAMVNTDMVDGCSNVSEEMAKVEASITCSQICMRAQVDWETTTGGVAARPGVSTGDGVVLDGAGILATWDSGGYVGYLPSSEEPIGPVWEMERLAEELVQRSSVPWVWLQGLGESIQWEDSRGSAAFVQAYWSNRGEPRPIGLCHHAVQRSCPLEDVKLGDSIQVCSAESETDAQRIAQTSCAPLRYTALSRSWGSWGIYGISEEGQYNAPAATVVAVGPGQFMGFIPSSLRVVGIHEDWVKLADELLERTAGTTVWLAGPAKFYAPEVE